MDVTDRNNEKFTKLLEVLGLKYQVHFYYNYRTKVFQYCGVTRGGFCPGEMWSNIVELYIMEHHEHELRELAEHEIKIRKGSGLSTFDSSSVTSEDVYPSNSRRD